MHWYSGVAATQGGMNIYYGRPRAADPTLAVGSVPGARTFSGLALSSVFPNPARGDLTVRYALADRSAADLEMLDVTGRRVARQALATTVNGAGEARFRVGSDVRAGIYWLRLSQAGRSTSTKLAVVR